MAGESISPASNDGPDVLLQQLAANPDDEDLRARTAMALTMARRHAEAETVLASLTNLSAHDGPTLPCLCRRCLQPGLIEAEADGMAFVRRFAVARGRVLYFWTPREQADNRGVLRAVQWRLQQRLARRDS